MISGLCRELRPSLIHRVLGFAVPGAVVFRSKLRSLTRASVAPINCGGKEEIQSQGRGRMRAGMVVHIQCWAGVGCGQLWAKSAQLARKVAGPRHPTGPSPGVRVRVSPVHPPGNNRSSPASVVISTQANAHQVLCAEPCSLKIPMLKSEPPVLRNVSLLG